MKRFIDIFKNIWKIEELRSKILWTLGLLAIYRVGTFVVLPGVHPAALGALNSQGSEGIVGLINLFSGGAFSNASIFALGIMPYISASIAMQLATLAIPYFQRLQKDGESGRRQINQYTRYITVLVTAAQAIAYMVNLKAQMQATPWGMPYDGLLFRAASVFMLTCGTIFVMWLGEKITDKGLGNGTSLIIMTGIVARLPMSILQEFGARSAQGALIILIIEIAALMLVVVGMIMLIQAVRKIPIQYAKRNVMKGGKIMQMGGVRQYLPLKLNASGVMPIIFAQAIMFIPATIAQFFGNNNPGGVITALSDVEGFWYNAIYFALVMIFTYFYTALIINPKQISEDLKKNGGFIPGVKPGNKTAEFIDNVISRITLPGSIFLSFVAVLPAIAMITGMDKSFALFYGGTSMLIMVGVVLDTLQQVESYLLMRNYDGLTKTGRIKGRSSAMSPVSIQQG